MSDIETQSRVRPRNFLWQSGEVGQAAPKCLVSCDHIPCRSWPLFRTKAMLGDLIARFSSPDIQSQQEQLAA